MELPLGTDHAEVKKLFAESREQPSASQFPKALPTATAAVEEVVVVEPPAPTRKKKAVELSEEQAKALGIDF